MKPSSPEFHLITVIADAGPGGAPTHVADLLAGLKQRTPKTQLTLIAPTGWLAETASPSARILPTPMTSSVSRGSHRAFRASLAAARAGAPNRPTIIHFHGVRAGTLGYLESRYHGRRAALPMVYTEHVWTRDYHLPNRLRELLQLRLLGGVGHRAARTIAVSQAVASFLLTKRLVPPEKLTVIPNGITLPPRPAPIPHRKKGDYRIGSIGALVPLKGYATLIRALPLIVQNLPDLRLTIIGDGPEKKPLRDLAERLHVARFIRLVGAAAAARDRMAEWDLFVSTSRSESFGLAIGEAMAAGRPVVATLVGGVPELVTPDTGRLVPPDDPQMLAKAIIDLLPQPGLRQQLGAAGRERITTFFSRDRMIDQTATVYDDVLKNLSA